MFDGNGFGIVDKALATMFGICLVSLPLGAWKLIEIIQWVIDNLHWVALPPQQ